MNMTLSSAPRLIRWSLFGLGMTVILYAQTAWQPAANAQNASADKAAAKAANDLAGPNATPAAPTPAAATAAPTPNEEKSLYQLYWDGGIFMHPILFFSFLMCACALERFIGLRTSKIIPPDLVQGLGEMSAQGGFDPRRAYRLCQEYPSTLANVVRAMLLKVGRPHSEVEQTVKEAKDGEATKLYSNVRPIALAQTVGPMLGLLGTVQGIIMAFSQISSTVNASNSNKFATFAEGIYTALITTFAGLCVAIPAACFCFYFEGRIQKLFQQIDDVLASLLPQVEKYEGKLRVSHDQLNHQKSPAAPAPVPPPVVAMPVKA
jgi:biopolymer transport protein ExbB